MLQDFYIDSFILIGYFPDATETKRSVGHFLSETSWEFFAKHVKSFRMITRPNKGPYIMYDRNPGEGGLVNCNQYE